MAVSGELQSLSWELTCVKCISYFNTRQTINEPSLVTADGALEQGFLPIIVMAFLQAEEGDRLYWLHSLKFLKTEFLQQQKDFFVSDPGVGGRTCT